MCGLLSIKDEWFGWQIYSSAWMKQAVRQSTLLVPHCSVFPLSRTDVDLGVQAQMRCHSIRRQMLWDTGLVCQGCIQKDASPQICLLLDSSRKLFGETISETGFSILSSKERVVTFFFTDQRETYGKAVPVQILQPSCYGNKKTFLCKYATKKKVFFFKSRPTDSRDQVNDILGGRDRLTKELLRLYNCKGVNWRVNTLWVWRSFESLYFCLFTGY